MERGQFQVRFGGNGTLVGIKHWYDIEYRRSPTPTSSPCSCGMLQVWVRARSCG